MLPLLKPSKMKKLVIVLIVFSFACSKNSGRTCWDCEVTRLDRSTYYQKVCNDGEYPKFTDRQGNKLTSFCSEWQDIFHAFWKYCGVKKPDSHSMGKNSHYSKHSPFLIISKSETYNLVWFFEIYQYAKTINYWNEFPFHLCKQVGEGWVYN